MERIITISGKAGAGKDTAAQFIKAKLKSCGKTVFIIHYADYLKFICKKYFDWNGEKDEAGRTMLQEKGDEIKAVNKDFFSNNVSDIIKAFANDYDYFIIPDARYPHEIDELKAESFPVISLRIERKINNGLTYGQRVHTSETALDDYLFNFTIKTESKELLKIGCEAFAKFLLNGSDAL